MAKKEHWLDAPEDHDYDAAASYLSMLLPKAAVDSVVAALRKAEPTTYKAKDLLRASGLALLPEDNEHVAKDRAKIDNGEKISPVLLVLGDIRVGQPLTVADGYHRICASYYLEEDADIPCHAASAKAVG